MTIAGATPKDTISASESRYLPMGEPPIFLATTPSNPSTTAAAKINTSAFSIALAFALRSTNSIAVKPSKALRTESKSGSFISFKMLSSEKLVPFIFLYQNVFSLYPDKRNGLSCGCSHSRRLLFLSILPASVSA
uniref:Uncharacterized protein n=1 Tax=Candidatus Methanophagaceae archaeon ANME-1 ERB6 TaxID=2759912 RepID=A0A7G9YTL5_9EURY|nr:hypothetical protein FBLENPID_00001 [Methanosarcinales archaeon ANME-1 ERB6]